MYKVLIIGASWLGDMVMTQALFKLLHQQGKVVDVLAPKWNHGILAAMPEVNQALEMPFDHGDLSLLARYKFAQTLKSHNYDECIVIPNSFKSALISFWAGIPKRTGWLGELRYFVLNNYKKLNKSALPLMVQRLVALGYFEQGKTFDQHEFAAKNLEEYYPQLSLDPNIVKSCLAKFNLNSDDKYLVLAPGAAFGEAKKWPEEYFASVALQKIQQGFKIILLGSKQDKVTTNRVNSLANNQLLDLAGMTQLVETVAIIAQAEAIVSNDSGLLHVAASVNTPLIAIYGSTSQDFTPPLITSSKKIILSVDNLSCRPCFQKTCRYGHLKCLRDLKPELINNAIDKVTDKVTDKACVS